MANNSNTPNPYQIQIGEAIPNWLQSWMNRFARSKPKQPPAIPSGPGTPGNKPGSKPKQPPAIPTYKPALHGPNPYQLGNQSQNTPAPAIPTAPGGGAAGGQVNQDSLQTLGGRRLFVDAARSEAGPTLWLNRQGQSVNPGDILPNLQDVFVRPIANNVQSMISGGTGARERALAESVEGESERDRNMRAINAFIDGALSAPTSSAIPQIVMNAFNVASQEVENLTGAVAMSQGQSVPGYLLNSPATQVPLAPLRMGMNLNAPIRTLAINYLRNHGRDDAADTLESNTLEAPIAEQLANAILMAESRGVNTSVLRSALALVTPSPDLLLENARGMRAVMENGNRWDAFNTARQASHFAYEDPELQMEAYQRIANGENAEDVYRDINENLTLVQRMKDLGLQIVLDPLNLVGAGLAGRATDFAQTGFRTFMQDSSQYADEIIDGMRLGNFRPSGTAPGLAERVLPFMTRRTPESRANYVMTETSNVLRNLMDYNTPAAEIALREAGIFEHPGMVILDLLSNPASDDVMGSGLHADDVRRILGMEVRPPTATEISRMGADPDRMVDILNSDAAIRTREILNNTNIVGDAKKGIAPVSELMQRLEDTIAEAGRATSGSEARQLLNAADDVRIEIMERLRAASGELTARENEYGALWRGLLSVKKKASDPTKGVFAYLHMHIVPGYYVRNFATDTVTAVADGINMLTPIRDVARQVGDWDVSIPIREAGARFDALQDTVKLPTTGIMESFRAGERHRQERAFLAGFERFMSAYYPDVVMDSDEFARLATALGNKDLTNRVLALVQREWNPANLDRVLDDVAGLAPAQLIPEDIAELLNPYQMQDIQGILRSTPDPDTLIQRLQDYALAAERRVDTTTANPSDLDIDTIALTAHDSMMEAMGGLTEAQRRESLVAFQDRVRFARIERDRVYEYACQTLQDLVRQFQGTPQAADMQRVFDNFNVLMRNKNHLYGTRLQRALDDFWIPLNEQDWTAIQRLPGFDGILGPQDLSEAWRRYHSIKDAVYEMTSARLADEFMAAANEARAIAGLPAMTVEEVMRRSELVGAGADTAFTLSRKSRQSISTMMNRILRDSSFNPRHAMNWLKKYQFVPADRSFLLADDITDLDFIRRFLDQINTSGIKLSDSPQTTRAIEQLRGLVDNRYQAYDIEASMLPFQSIVDDILNPQLDEAEQAAEAVADTVTSETPFNMAHVLQQESTSLNNALERLVQHIMSAGDSPASELTGQQVQAIRDFVTAMRGRLTDTRTLAHHVGQATMDFTQHNYADRRNIDTLMGVVFAYPYWHTRNMMNFARRAYQTPGTVAAMIKFRQAIRNMNAGLPEWWKDQVSFEKADGGRFFANLLAFDPLNGFFGDKFRDPDQRDTRFLPGSNSPLPLGLVLNEANQYGPSIHPFLQYAIAASALLQGKKDQALSWVGYTSLPTKAFRALTVYARMGADRLLGEDRQHQIPAGGSILEPWLSFPTGDGVNVGDKWQRQRIGVTLWEMVSEEGIPYELALEAAYYQDEATGEALDLFMRAAQRTAEKDGWRDLLAYFIASAVRPRNATEMDITRMDMERRNLMANMGSMTPDERAAAFQQLNEDYPYADLVFMFRQDPTERDTTLAWNVINRLPPNSSQILEAAGIDPSYLDEFYESGLDGMPPLRRQDFMTAIQQLSIILQAPSDITREAWNDAAQRRRAMVAELERQFPNYQYVVDEYYQRLGEEGPEGAQAVMDANPWLANYFDTKDALIAADPLLTAYYGSFDQLERYMWDNWYTEANDLYPGASELSAQYGSLMETNPDAARALLDANKELLTGYWDAKNEAQLEINNALASMGDTLNGYQPILAGLVSDPDVQTAGGQRVADLLASGPAALDRFQLPDDFEAETLKAEIKSFINAIPTGSYGSVVRELRAMGDLDDVLTAFRSIGSTGTVAASMEDMTRLRDALEQITRRFGSGYTSASSGGGSGGSSGRRSSSRYSGGRGGSGGGTNTRVSDDRTIGDVLNQLQSASPSWWGWLRNMADMTEDDMKAFLKDPAHAGLVSWLKAALDVYNLDLKALLDYFRSGKHLMPASKTSKSGSSSYKPNVRFSSPYL